MNRSSALLLTLFLSACAMPGEVQRITVDYNTAVAAMSNQLTLLNIVRAKEGLPTYYTSVGRLSGSISVQANAGFNAQIKADQPVVTNSTTSQAATTNGTTVTDTNGTTGSLTTTTAPTGTTVANATGTSTSVATATAASATNTITNLVQQAITKGGNIYTPSVGGQISSGPSFDVSILDTQEFYQGVLTQVPMDVLQTYIDDGYDNQLLARLFIERIDFVLTDDVATLAKYKKGDTIDSLVNLPSGPLALRFATAIACYAFSAKSSSPDPINDDATSKKNNLAPLSRLTQDSRHRKVVLKLSDLALFANGSLTLSKPISADPADDANVIVKKPAEKKPTAELTKLSQALDHPLSFQTDGHCYTPETIADIRKKIALEHAAPGGPAKADAPKTFDIEIVKAAAPTPPAYPIYEAGKLTRLDDGNNVIQVPVKMTMILRSPEGLIRFLGRYLAASDRDPSHTYGYTTLLEKPDGSLEPQARPLFSVSENNDANSLVSVDLLENTYAIENDRYRSTNMTILGLVEQLVNLQKSAATHPTTQPVEIVQ